MPLLTEPVTVLPAQDVQFEHPPLNLVVCQVRTESALGLDEEAVKALRGRLREHYPNSQELRTVMLQVSSGGESKSESAIGGYRFASVDGLWRVVINPDSVALETQAYERWEGFAERLRAFLDVVCEVVNPALELRLGLRYVNEIDLEGIERASDWAYFINDDLIAQAIGSAPFARSLVAAQQFMLIDVGESAALNFRHGFVSPQVEGRERQVYLLDFDCYREQSRDFSVDDLLVEAGRFNAIMTSLFQWATKPALWERMSPRA